MSTRVSFVYVPPENVTFTDEALRRMSGQRAPVTHEGVKRIGTVRDVRAREGGDIEITVELDEPAARAVSPSRRVNPLFRFAEEDREVHRGPAPGAARPLGD